MRRSRNRKPKVGVHQKFDVARGRAKRGLATLPDQRRQAAALVFRILEDRGLEILLLTSRRTGRAVIPKGWLGQGEEGYQAAAREAYEEAGIVGRIDREPLGTYEYLKKLETKDEVLLVNVYALQVERERKKWPEQDCRERRWLRPTDAAKMVDEPALAALIRWFTPPG